MIGQSAGRSRKNPTTGAVRSTPRQRQRLAPPPSVEVESFVERRWRGWPVLHTVLMWVGILTVALAPAPWPLLSLVPLGAAWSLVAREASWNEPVRRYTPKG